MHGESLKDRWQNAGERAGKFDYVNLKLVGGDFYLISLASVLGVESFRSEQEESGAEVTTNNRECIMVGEGWNIRSWKDHQRSDWSPLWTPPPPSSWHFAEQGPKDDLGWKCQRWNSFNTSTVDK
jgi:hypothetical protein